MYPVNASISAKKCSMPLDLDVGGIPNLRWISITMNIFNTNGITEMLTNPVGNYVGASILSTIGASIFNWAIGEFIFENFFKI